MGMSESKMLIKCKVTRYHVHVTLPSLFWKLGFDLQAILMFRHEQVKRDIYKQEKNIGLKKKHRVLKK